MTISQNNFGLMIFVSFLWLVGMSCDVCFRSFTVTSCVLE